MTDPAPPSTLAARILAEGEGGRGGWHARSSLFGEPRGPLCGMGVCFECRRPSPDGADSVLSCLVPADPPVRTVDPEERVRRKADLVVVGGGPGGIAAATRAAESGLSVLLLDLGLAPGGQIWRHRSREDLPPEAASWVDRFRRSGAEALFRAEVVDGGRLPGGRIRLLAVRDGCVIEVDADSVILATGARERFVPFPGWTLPGVVGIGGIQALVKAGAPVRGLRIVLAGSGPLLLPVAATLVSAGAHLVSVSEQAPFLRVARFGAGLWRSPRLLLTALRHRTGFRSVPYRFGSWVTRAVEGEGEGKGPLREVELTDGRKRWTERCDILATGFGLLPETALPRLFGCELREGVVVTDALQRTSVPGIHAVGEVKGIGGAVAAVREGEIAGWAVAGRVEEAERAARRGGMRDAGHRTRIEAGFRLREELRGLAEPETILCRCEDVRMKQLDPGWGFRAAKLRTRVGMGPCQGRSCGPILSHLFGWEADTTRPPGRSAPLRAFLRDDREEGGEGHPQEPVPPVAPITLDGGKIAP